MHFRQFSMTAAIAGMALLTGVVAGSAQAQQDGPTQGPHGAPNIQDLDSQNLDSNRQTDTNEVSNPNRVSDTTNRNSRQLGNLTGRRTIQGNNYFIRGDRSSVLVPQGPHGAFLPVRRAGFGGPDFVKRTSDFPKLEMRGPHSAPSTVY